MKANFIPFNAAIDGRGIAVSDRARLVAVVAAIATIITTSLPSTAVESPAGHYVVNVAPRVNNILSEFNENMVFDLRMAMDVARAFWLVRYSAAHPGAFSLFDRENSVFEILSGVPAHVSPDLEKFANDNKSAIVHLMPAAIALIEEITKMEI